ncbi:unnamed protein product, partial [Amoebophrya sp. A25]|eukprot:GSA25T00025155001.1
MGRRHPGCLSKQIRASSKVKKLTAQKEVEEQEERLKSKQIEVEDLTEELIYSVTPDHQRELIKELKYKLEKLGKQHRWVYNAENVLLHSNMNELLINKLELQSAAVSHRQIESYAAG